MDGCSIATFYKFCRIRDCANLQEKILNFCLEAGIKGTALIAPEGINATLAGPIDYLDKLLEILRSDANTSDLRSHITKAPDIPFDKLKIRVRKEIVRIGKKFKDHRKGAGGTLLDPHEWIKLLKSDVTTIDVRNNYESSLGTFKNAIIPGTKVFREFPDWFDEWSKNFDKKEPLAMFCTGGVRCEKSALYAEDQGFSNVLHLRGGILNYLDQTGDKSNFWSGSCFVFDDRVALSSTLDPYHNIPCSECGKIVEKKNLKGITRGKAFCECCKNRKGD